MRLNLFQGGRVSLCYPPGITLPLYEPRPNISVAPCKKNSLVCKAVCVAVWVSSTRNRRFCPEHLLFGCFDRARLKLFWQVMFASMCGEECGALEMVGTGKTHDNCFV